MPTPLNWIPKHRPDYACGECGEIGHNASLCPKLQERRHRARRLKLDESFKAEVERLAYRTRGILEAPTPPIPRETVYRRVDLSYLRQPRESE